MDKLELKLDRDRRYEAYSIFGNDKFSSLVSELRLADCMKAEVSYFEDSTEVEADSLVVDIEVDLSISDTLTCSYCCTKFVSKIEQRNHYKLDWHRHNLKQHLKGLSHILEDDFDKLNDDDVSSISGSETESSSEEERNATQLTKIIRHPKIFFVNKENQVLSLFRCILHGKEDIPSSNEALFKLAQTCNMKTKWAIIMLGGGHFAAAIFKGKSAVLHKTFHSYTVRARQGGSQGARDGKSGTSHPKSAGASLRRYNEAAFQQHINDLLETWEDQLSKCDVIFLRAVSHNRTLIFNGKNSTLKKNDPRIRSIPFPTRRATFKEVQRVHELLSLLEIYGSAEEFMEQFPVTPKKQNSEPCLNKVTATEGLPKKRNDRDKEREILSRPLPKVVEKLAESSDDGSLGNMDDSELVMMTQVLDLSRDLEEFDDDVPEGMKQKFAGRRQRRRPKKKKKDKTEENEGIVNEKEETAESLSEIGICWKKLLFSSRHDTQIMMQVMQDSDSVMDEKILIIHSPIDTRGNNLLHEAAHLGLLDRVKFLLESGLDPSVPNKEGKVPYRVSKDTETRKVMRRFQADNPHKYNYQKAEVPGPLTDEIERMENEAQAERKKAKRDAKKDKLVEKKKADALNRKFEEIKKAENEERLRFLKMSDREKCALAAERRLLASGGEVQLQRCFVCASDMSGKVPFCYQTFKFCTMECLKAHRYHSK